MDVPVFSSGNPRFGDGLIRADVNLNRTGKP